MKSSFSEASFATSGTGTTRTGKEPEVNKKNDINDSLLWTGRLRHFTIFIVSLPWNMYWQSIVAGSITLNYLLILLNLIKINRDKKYLFLGFIFEVLFIIDVVLKYFHMCWQDMRGHVRVYRKPIITMIYDTISIFPFYIPFSGTDIDYYFMLVGKFIAVGRIYRLYFFSKRCSELMYTFRKLFNFVETLVAAVLVLHAATCFCYHTKSNQTNNNKYGFPYHVGIDIIRFDSYKFCCYYCTCYLLNCVLGDCFPLNAIEKYLTVIISMIGFIAIRYRFIGSLTYIFTIEDLRRLNFVNAYHHMCAYLKLRGAPQTLIDQATEYKKTMWQMKDGVMTSSHIHNFPTALQMELIFDINVGYFHRNLLFKDTDEAFIRQVSLLMKHEIYLEGQTIWSQGVVKYGMICIKRGVIEMLSDEDDESPMIAFKEGTILGELSLFYSIPAKVTVKAATYVELQILKRTDFIKNTTEQITVLHQLRNKIDLRLQSSRDRKSDIIEYDKGDSRLIRSHYRPMKALKDYLSGVEGEDPTFVDDSHMYYRDKHNIRKQKFSSDNCDLYRLSENITNTDNPKICLNPSFPWILEPDTSFTTMLDVMHFMLVVYGCFMCPFLALAVRLGVVLEVLAAIVTTGLLLNIYVQLTTAIVHKNTRIETVKEIAEIKMATIGFYLDLLSVFPFYIFTEALDPAKKTIWHQLCGLGPLLQVWHIWDYFKKWERDLTCHILICTLVKFTLIVVIGCYWTGFFLYLYSCPRQRCDSHSWMMMLVNWETKVYSIKEPMHAGNALFTCLYFGALLFTNAGCSGIMPGKSDLIMVLFCIVVGYYIFCIYISKICSIYVLSTRRKLNFKESMRELFYFLSVNHVSHKIKDRVQRFFCVQWYYNYAITAEELFSDASTNIKQEVLSMEMVKTLMLCPLFKDCSSDFLHSIASKCRSLVLPDNETVMHAADIGRDMYIIQEGYCNVLNYQGTIVNTIGPGKDFGFLEMFYGLPKVHTVITSTNCILLHIEYTDLVQCWSTFPDVGYPINKALQDPEIIEKVKYYEKARPLETKMELKMNRIAQELKESFVFMSTAKEKREYRNVFENLGLLRYMKYILIPGCITPYGMFLKVWCFLRFAVAIFYVIVIPYYIAVNQYTMMSFSAADIFLYADLVVMGYVAYYNEKNLLVTHPLYTIKRYLKTSFIVDAITVCPIELLLKVVNDQQNNMEIFRLNKLLQVTRIAGSFHYWEQNIMSVNHAVVYFKFLPYTLTIVNFATAYVMRQTCKMSQNANNVILANCSNFATSQRLLGVNQDAVTSYMHSFLWVFHLFIGSGCFPRGQNTNTEVIVSVIIAIFGFIYFAFMYGFVASARISSSHSLLEYKEKSKDLENFLYEANVDSILIGRTMKYFDYVWKRTSGSNPQQICLKLNSALMEDTLVFMYEKTLREVPLFGNVERSFIRVITQHLSEMYFLRGETVIQCRDIQPYIYIIYRGKVDVLSSFNEMITCMGPGGMFGNFTGTPIASSEVTINATRSLDLLVIPTQTFFRLVKYYPKIQEPLNKAFQSSRDYILPISMDSGYYNSTDDESDSQEDTNSENSIIDNKSSNEAAEFMSKTSQSNLSSTKSSALSSASYSTRSNYWNVTNFFTPGSWLLQIFGYTSCCMATASYVLVLYGIVTMNESIKLYWIQAFLDVFFYVQVYLSMHKGYSNKRGEIVISVSRCRRRYCKRTLEKWTDIIANLPLQWIGLFFSTPRLVIHCLRLNNVLRMKYLFQFYKQTSAELTNNLTLLQAVMTIFVTILVIHTITCSWLLAIMSQSAFIAVKSMKMQIIDMESPLQHWNYITALYVVVGALTTTGGDELSLSGLVPLMILALSIIFGKVLSAVVISTCMHISHSNKHALTSYDLQNYELIDVLQNQGLSRYQLKKFWLYIKQLWIDERGRQLPELLAQTPYVRRCDLMSAMFSQHLRNCYLFADTGEAFLRQLTVVLNYTVFFPGNYITVAGDSESQMYWVNSGTVAVVSVRTDLTEITHEYLRLGDMFGLLQGLHKGMKHCFSYRAETKVTILSLNLDSWIHILPFFPEAQKIINDRAERLISQNLTTLFM